MVCSCFRCSGIRFYVKTSLYENGVSVRFIKFILRKFTHFCFTSCGESFILDECDCSEAASAQETAYGIRCMRQEK